MLVLFIVAGFISCVKKIVMFEDLITLTAFWDGDTVLMYWFIGEEKIIEELKIQTMITANINNWFFILYLLFKFNIYRII